MYLCSSFIEENNKRSCQNCGSYQTNSLDTVQSKNKNLIQQSNSERFLLSKNFSNFLITDALKLFSRLVGWHSCAIQKLTREKNCGVLESAVNNFGVDSRQFHLEE